eukprot:3526066-Amphidinium_carterae.1
MHANRAERTGSTNAGVVFFVTSLDSHALKTYCIATQTTINSHSAKGLRTWWIGLSPNDFTLQSNLNDRMLIGLICNSCTTKMLPK